MNVDDLDAVQGAQSVQSEETADNVKGVAGPRAADTNRHHGGGTGAHGAVSAVAIDRLERFQSVTASLLECLTPADCAETLLREGAVASGASAGAVLLLNQEHGHLELLSAHGYGEADTERLKVVRLDEPDPAAEAVRNSVPVYSPSGADRHDESAADRRSTSLAQSSAALPFLMNGRAFGCLVLSYAGPRDFDQDERSFLVSLALQGALALERARLYATVSAQRAFLKDVLASVTDGRLVLCDTPDDLPAEIRPAEEIPLVHRQDVRRLRLAVIAAAAQCAFPEERTDDLALAASEAATNAVVHGGGGVGRTGADSEEGRVQVWVIDRGSGIAFHRLPKAILQRGFTTAGTLGHGFKMILRLVDRIYLHTSHSGTTIVLEMGQSSPDADPVGSDVLR